MTSIQTQVNKQDVIFSDTFQQLMSVTFYSVINWEKEILFNTELSIGYVRGYCYITRFPLIRSKGT
jgi:hypothetical protein